MAVFRFFTSSLKKNMKICSELFRMLVKGLFVWIFCTTIAAAQFVFQPENIALTNLVIDNSTENVYVGGVNYIFKLNKNLTQLNNVSTKCLADGCATVTSNTNQLLIIENLEGTPRLFACGTYSYGLCVTYDINSLSYTVLEGTAGAVSSNTQYGSIALEDPTNNGILIATTTFGDEETPKDYTLNTYESNQCGGTIPMKPCIGQKNSLILSNARPKMYYILAVIVGKFRYFFSHNMDDGTNVARLCESYYNVFEIKTYMEIPLQCVGKDGTNYKQLVAAKVIRPDGKLAEKFGSTGNDDDAVLIGVFQKSSTSSESALCTYTFKEINDTFWKNIKECSGSNSLTLNKYVSNSKCRMESPPDQCSPSSRNQKMTGTIKYESKALATCSDCGFISSVDTTSYQGNIIAFLGEKDGKLSKFIIYSNSSGRKYNSSNTTESGISSVKFDRVGNSAYLLSQNKVLKIPVEECWSRKTCESCVVDGDPYCGWCTLKATCTTNDKCPYYGSSLGFVRYSNECITISNVTPPSLPLSETKTQKINISIVNLPVRQINKAYGCSVNGIEVPSTLNGDTMECLVPTSGQLPKASSETGFVKAEIAVFSNETNAKITTAMLEFYNCSAISSCSKCTTGSLNCSWCHYEAECTADASTICPSSFASWVSEESQHQCPLLNNQTFYIPASVEREVTLRGKQFPKPASPNGEYQCTLTYGSQLYSIPATWNNSTSITCGAQQHKYSASSIEISANLSVKLGKSDVGDPIKVYLYQCRRTAELCGSCVGMVAKVEYKCGWCVNAESSCSVRDGCSSGQWVKPLGKCPKEPQIQSFYPKTGHVKGNSRLEINGTEFGRKYEDVEEVSIAGLQCKTIKEDYVIAERIVCLTSNSSKSLSAKIKIKIAGKVGYSKEEFHYQNPQVEDYEPKKGPVSGGTKVTIFGKELNTGIDIQVFLGWSKCLDLRVTQTNMTCTTSQFKNVTRKRRSISNDNNLVVTFDGLPPVYSRNITSFQYVPDPNITDITPRFTFPSSHRPINVTGSNLDGIHFPRIRLTFEDKRYPDVEEHCDKPSFDNMMCRFPSLTKITAVWEGSVLNGQFSLYLDGVTTWVDLSGYPQFNSITIVPDPVVFKFPDGIFVLKSTILEIKGKNFVVKEKTDLLKFNVTVGGEKCNITVVAQEVIYCKAPEHSSLPKLDSYEVVVNVSSSSLQFILGKLKYAIDEDDASSADMLLIYIIIGVGAGVLVFLAFVMFWYCRRKNRQQEQNERNYEMQMNSLESKVAKECREAFAELQTDMTDFTTDLGDGSIHFFDFKNYAMRVLFPGVTHHEVMDEKLAKESPNWDEALRTFSQLIGNKSFLLIFVKTLENQSQFKMQDRCNVASLLVVALQSKMDYCTDILQHLLAELIRKSMSRSHPKLLLRRTECIAEKLLTNWLTFTLSNFVKDKAGKPLFMLYKAIRFQIEKGPVDVITNEARYSLSEDKLLRQSIEYNKLTVTVEFEDNPPVEVDVLDTDTIEQAKEKIMEVLFKNVPFSCRQPKDELILKWVESPSNHTILKDEDTTSLREGEWKRLNTLGHYQVPDGTCLRLVRRFASGLDTSEIHNASLPKVTYSPSVYSTSSLVQSSKHNISDAERKPWHLSKHVDSYVQEKDDPRHSKMLSEIYLTRLLSTKGTLQQYVDDMFNCIFPTFRKNERPPLPIKFLFDFLDDQARELNITDPEVLHTWKNNSLPLRFWVNLIKNPNFLFDVYKAPIVDSCLSVIAQLFMDSCSVSEHVLGKDSPSNKLLYAKEIPAYKNKVESFYRDVANAPRLTDEEIKDFFSAHYIEDFNVDSALKQLYQYAAKYQDELQEALEDARYPQLASKLEHVVAIFSDD